MEGYGKNLAQPRELRTYKPSGSGPDMAFNALDPRVRRILIGRIFGSHYSVTSRPAEIHRIHVFDSAIRCSADNEKVEYGGEDHPLQGPPNHGQTQVDGRERSRQSAASAQASSLEPNANGNQQQSEHKNARQDQKNQKANVRMRRPGQEDVIEPESDGGERGARSDHSPCKGDRILPQEINWLRPVSETLSQIHLRRHSLALSCPGMETHSKCRRGVSAAVGNLPDLDCWNLLFQSADVSHQPLNVLWLQRRVLGHIVLAVRNDVGELCIRHFLHVGTGEVVGAHFLSHRRTGSVRAMAGCTFRFEERGCVLRVYGRE